MFGKCYAALKPGGSLWISDLIAHDDPAVQAVMWQRYGEYLTQLKGEAYRDQVFGYIEQEDTPRPLLYQLHLLKQVGFQCSGSAAQECDVRGVWRNQIVLTITAGDRIAPAERSADAHLLRGHLNSSAQADDRLTSPPGAISSPAECPI